MYAYNRLELMAATRALKAMITSGFKGKTRQVRLYGIKRRHASTSTFISIVALFTPLSSAILAIHSSSCGGYDAVDGKGKSPPE